MTPDFPSNPTPEFTEADHRFMRQALGLAAIPLGQTRPNPMVGCVIVQNNQVIGQGFHNRAGEPHAERVALANCTQDTAGSTVYVTLEPCTHHGKTPPCTDALIAAKVGRVVIAQQDPNPQAKEGAALLTAAGIPCQVGLLQQEAQLLNASFNLFHRHKTPLITLKWAMTLDGCTSTTTGHSHWITGPQARLRVHQHRAAHDCVVVGIATALQDQARLTVRDVPLLASAPRRIVLDSHLQLPPTHPLILADPKTAVIVGLSTANSTRRQALEAAGATVIQLPANPQGQIELQAFVDWCAAENLQSLYVEGGRRVAGAFWSAGLVHRIFSFINPSCIGFTTAGLSPLQWSEPETNMQEKTILHQVQTEQLGDDVLISGWTKQALSLLVE